VVAASIKSIARTRAPVGVRVAPLNAIFSNENRRVVCGSMRPDSAAVEEHEELSRAGAFESAALFLFRAAAKFRDFLLQPFGPVGEPLRARQDFVDAGIAFFVVIRVVASRLRHGRPC
jgi:hypothetical protein